MYTDQQLNTDLLMTVNSALGTKIALSPIAKDEENGNFIDTPKKSC